MNTPIKPHCPGRTPPLAFTLLVWLISLVPSFAQTTPGANPLTIVCPTNITLWTCNSEIPWQYQPPTVSGGCSNKVVVCNPPSGSAFPLGVTTVTCRVTDSCQNSATCTFTVTVRRDTEPPSIKCPTNLLVKTCPTAAGGCAAVVNYPDPQASDNSGQFAVVCVPPSGSVFPCGTTVVNCRVEDRCGNKDECRFEVTVELGGEKPSIQCPPDLTLTTCSNTAVLNYPAPVVLPAGTTVICNPPVNTLLPLGTHAVTCIATNTCGTDVCTFKVTVRPAPQPTIQCPTNQFVFTVPCGSNCVPIIYPDPVVSNGTLIECSPRSGTCLPVGVHVVTCIATNPCDRVACEFVVRVIEGQSQPPQIRCPSNVVAWTCTSNGVPVQYPAPTVIPGSDPTPTVTCVPPIGSVFPPGVTTVVCSAKDDCGNEDRCTFTVTVRRDVLPPDIHCPSNIVRCVTNGATGANVTFTPTATDNADPTPTIVCNPPSGTFFPLGTTVVICRATDDCGNESKCSFTVTVVDDRKPKLSIRRDGRFVIVCWPKTCSCYKLQSTRSLNPPIVWTDVATVPDEGFDSWCVRLPIDERHRFFRLVSCNQTTAPVWDVTATGITAAQAAALGEALKIPRDGLHLRGGELLFMDPVGFQAIPTLPIQDQGIIDELARGTENDKGELKFEGIDFAKLRELRPPSGEEAMKLFAGALRAADLLPASGDPHFVHSMFEATDEKGEPMMPETPIDTQVEYEFDLLGIPLIGPGAKMSLALGADGKPTALRLATRQLKPSQLVPLIPVDEAARRCAALYPQLRSSTQPKLVYYAPGLDAPGARVAVQKVIPCYDCGGSAPVQDQQVQLLRSVIPATDELAFVPAVQLEAGAQGSLVNAKATVHGGTPPYSYEWSSSSVDLSGLPADASSIEYQAQPRSDLKAETVKVIVTDANGVKVHASQTVEIAVIGVLESLVFAPAVGGVSDYGTERGVSDLCAAQQSAFNARFAADGYVRRFNWAAATAWERDFKEGPTGLDHLYVDNVDMTFYMGHGYGGGFTFENNHDDTVLYYTDAAGAWGDIDLEWLALLSCSVIADTYDGKTWAQRWGPTFAGLHLLCGFENTAYDEAGFGHAFANWMLGYDLGFIKLQPMPIRSAWFMARDGNQPSSVIAVTMGVIGPAGCSNYNDYFWGKGPVGPDIRGANIRGYWRVRHH